MRKIKIYPSLLAADFSRLAGQIGEIEKAGADGIHLDVMDGHFVPNISFGPVVIRSIRKTTTLNFWAHLMITDPDKYLKPFHEAGVQGITIHPETGKEIGVLADEIHDLGLSAGVALNPDTDIDVVENVLHKFERILIMSVHPGFGGQSFMPEVLDKIEALDRLFSTMADPPNIDVDGGIDVHTAPRVVKAGATGLVVGSAIFRADNLNSALQSIREAVEAQSR